MIITFVLKCPYNIIQPEQLFVKQNKLLELLTRANSGKPV